MPNRMNARQKRHAKARLKALQDAIARNPSVIASEGEVRSSTQGAKARIIETTWHGFAKGRKACGMIPQRKVTIEGSPLTAHEGKANRPPNPKFRVEGSVKPKERVNVDAPHRKVSGFDGLRLAAAKRKLQNASD